MAASATFALKAGVWFRRGLLLIVSPDSLGTTVPAVRQKLHLSSCADFRDRLFVRSVRLAHAGWDRMLCQRRIALCVDTQAYATPFGTSHRIVAIRRRHHCGLDAI